MFLKILLVSSVLRIAKCSLQSVKYPPVSLERLVYPRLREFREPDGYVSWVRLTVAPTSHYNAAPVIFLAASHFLNSPSLYPSHFSLTCCYFCISLHNSVGYGQNNEKCLGEYCIVFVIHKLYNVDQQ